MDKSKQAFPVPCQAQQGGMTLREYYAGLAMQGLMPKYIKDRHEGYDEEYFTRDCLRIADALIARLEEDK